jgi:hypothetical protein
MAKSDLVDAAYNCILERDANASCLALDSVKSEIIALKKKLTEAREAFGEKSRYLADISLEYEQRIADLENNFCGGGLDEITDELIYALGCAADFLDIEEWAEPAEREGQEKAYRQAAVIIRKLTDNLEVLKESV